MEINKMLSLSTGHVSEDTARLMDNDAIGQVVIYDKPNFGWFVHVPERFELDEVKCSCPNDLFQCLDFAEKRGCGWIMFDSDVEPINELNMYRR